MHKFESIGLALLMAVPLSCASIASAVASEAKPKVIRLEPKTMKGVDQGKAVVVKGEASSTPHRFVIDKVTYMMPIAVAVRPVNKGDEVGLKVTKYAWNQPLRDGTTDGDLLRYTFRTEGEFQVSVDSKKPHTPYRLAVWVGDETKPKFAPVVVKASEFEGESKGGFGSLVLWVIAGSLVLIVALLGTLVLRRKSS